MAAEVPVSDVLCEAVEYLSKLGANLRTRSEKLKGKKISKEKLKNAHAVQRAANKLLLICELSKRSLNNVENGVKKIISVVSASQNKSNADIQTSPPRCITKLQYFEFENYNLRISKRVPVQHYLSAKVSVCRMSISTLEKYPVYLDCKLYRSRKFNGAIESSSEKDAIVSDKCEVNSNEANIMEQVKTDTCENIENGANCSDNNVSKLIDDKCHSNLHSNSSELVKEMVDSSKNKRLEKKNVDSENENEIVENEKIDESKSKQFSTDEKSDKDEDNLGEKNEVPTGNRLSLDSDSTSVKKSNVRNLKTKEMSKKFKRVSFLDESSSESEVKKNSNSNSKSIENKTESRTDAEATGKDEDDVVCISPDHSSDGYESQDSGAKKDKSFIKCVNISQLLKPDIIKKIGTQVVEKHIKKIDKREHKKPRISSKENITMESEDKEYWEQKRKEVRAFKAKNFRIMITRLPTLDNEFLIAYKLHKITKFGVLLLEQELEKNSHSKENNCFDASSKETSDNIEKDEHDMVTNEEAQRIKDALLNESESEADTDQKQKSPKNKRRRSKSIDLNQAAKDSNIESTESITPKTNSEETASENKEKSDKHTQRQCVTPERSESNVDIKSALLNDSSEDLTPQKKKKKTDETSPKSKTAKKDSLQAKEMLMAYSSSESEDEAFSNTLKNIKDQLLKGASSDEEILKEDSKKVSDTEENKKNFTSDGADEVKLQQSDSKESGKDTDSSHSDNKPRKKKISRSRAKFRRKRRNKSHTEDESHIKGLTNLKSLSKRRRRRASTSSSEPPEPVLKRSPRIRSKMDKKAPRISKEDFLEAHSESQSESDDAVSEAENDAGLEELPSVQVSGLNGDSIGHLAKDDLLGESDSSASNDDKTDEKETEDSKKPSSDTEDSAVKSKRRKANAISSDSEAGSSRKKEKNVKLSDFEDSEDESSESVKPNSKRKKEPAESDGSDSGSDDGSKKKRRRIKQVDDSDMSGSDDEDGLEGRNKHGRKNIRKVMGKNQLEEATKKAAREEKERIARIAERQKMYNNLDFDESGKPDEVVLEKVVLDFDPETKEPLIQVDRGLVKKLKPHQANGIKFMWDACFESVKRIKKDRGSGCILAHCMGLGKTLQVISLTHTLLSHSELTGVQRVLVVCPLSTVLNWVNEIKMWLKHTQSETEVDVYELSRFKQNSERAFQLQQWLEHGGVCVLGYEMFRNLSADNAKKFKKKMLKSFQQSLVDPGPDLVVCDEGHLLKNEKTSLSQSMNRVKTRRRIVLTGTPLQNNLKEYYCMVQFVKPNLLGKYNEYLNRFVNPITNGQYTDSTEHDIKIMKRRSHVLHKMLDGAVQRRDYGVLAPFLPPKHEYVLFITLSEVQVKLYQYYLDNFSRRPLPGKSSGFLFPDFQSLQRIWTHPLVLKYNSERYEIMQQKKREREEEEDSEGSLVDFIDDDSTPDESTTDESSDELSDASDDSRKKSKKKKSPKKSKSKDSKVSTRRVTRANPVELDEAAAAVEDVVEVKNENPTEWWIKLVEDDVLDDVRHSHKLVLLFDILRQCEAIGDKLLVFSQSLYSLDLIEHFLGKVDEATQEGRIDEKLAGHVGSWSPGVDYFRLDGSTSCENRSIWCKHFNREDNPRARLFLISTRAGGLGINLVAANRVVIFDVSWNPSHDVQSIFRVYRFGQKKPCYVYRFLAMGTMEEKIYERQVTKQAISKRVIDEQQIDRHYAENDLAELYKFEPVPSEARPIPPLPRDRLFAEMLREHDKEIYKYHEHDSLLENKEEETLSEEERKAAWEDFENEKNRPPPAALAAPWPMHNGLPPNLFVQQQQQLAYAAIAAMLRKDAPNITDNQIRDMLPLIYNSNPALMQKMSEIYKYAASAQPGLLNPAAMMNSVMNAGGGGGSSGLQYSPPWQRQQQQMLQQMLQQQQQMPAKYYAGGLGSRDPVAMALQQQRARQLLQPPARPRGRPPHHAAPSDVVHLDSD